MLKSVSNLAFLWVFGLFLKEKSSVLKLSKHISSSQKSFYSDAKEIFENAPFIKREIDGYVFDYSKFIEHYHIKLEKAFQIVKKSELFKPIEFENFKGFLLEVIKSNTTRNVVYFPIFKEIQRLAQSRSIKKEEISEDFFVNSIFLSPFSFVLFFFPIISKWDQLTIKKEIIDILLLTFFYVIEFEGKFAKIFEEKIENNKNLTENEKNHFLSILRIQKRLSEEHPFIFDFVDSFNILFTLTRKYKIYPNENFIKEYKKFIKDMIDALKIEIDLLKNLLSIL